MEWRKLAQAEKLRRTLRLLGETGGDAELCNSDEMVGTGGSGSVEAVAARPVPDLVLFLLDVLPDDSDRWRAGGG